MYVCINTLYFFMITLFTCNIYYMQSAVYLPIIYSSPYKQECLYTHIHTNTQSQHYFKFQSYWSFHGLMRRIQ